MDVARIYAESYVEIPEMYQFFKGTEDILDSCILHKDDGANAHTEWFHLKDIMPESTTGENINAMEEFLDMPLSEHSNYADIFIIDLAQSDDVLKMAFEQKLKEIREKEASKDGLEFWHSNRTKRFSDAEIRKIVEYRIFAYIDLYILGVMTNRKFTDVEMAAMIYPPKNSTPLNFDAVDRIARTVKPKALELLERTNPLLLL